jgi:hypothetical protein
MKKLTKEQSEEVSKTLLNKWLAHHNITIDDIPPEVTSDSSWYTLYAVTKTQHDEWEKWAIEYLSKVFKIKPNKLTRIGWGMVYLNHAPAIKKQDENEGIQID